MFDEFVIEIGGAAFLRADDDKVGQASFPAREFAVTDIGIHQLRPDGKKCAFHRRGGGTVKHLFQSFDSAAVEQHEIVFVHRVREWLCTSNDAAHNHSGLVRVLPVQYSVSSLHWVKAVVLGLALVGRFFALHKPPRLQKL